MRRYLEWQLRISESGNTEAYSSNLTVVLVVVLVFEVVVVVVFDVVVLVLVLVFVVRSESKNRATDDRENPQLTQTLIPVIPTFAIRTSQTASGTSSISAAVMFLSYARAKEPSGWVVAVPIAPGPIIEIV